MKAAKAHPAKDPYFLPKRLGVETLKNNADAAAHRGEWDCALGLWSAALEVDDQIAPLWHRLGVGLQQLGAAQKALHSYQRALELEPGLTEARCGLAGILEERGQLSEALGVLEEGVSLAPNSLILQKWLARSLENAGRLAQALEHWEVCARLEELPEDQWLARAHAAALRKKLPQAKAADRLAPFALRLAQ